MRGVNLKAYLIDCFWHVSRKVRFHAIINGYYLLIIFIIIIIIIIIIINLSKVFYKRFRAPPFPAPFPPSSLLGTIHIPQANRRSPNRNPDAEGRHENVGVPPDYATTFP